MGWACLWDLWTLDRQTYLSGLSGENILGLLQARVLFQTLPSLPLFPSVQVRIELVSGALGILESTAPTKGFVWCVASLRNGCQKSGVTGQQGRGCISRGQWGPGLALFVTAVWGLLAAPPSPLPLHKGTWSCTHLSQ